MGGLSIWHILIVAALLVLLFGRGKISSLMGDLAQGIKNFREGMKDDKDQPKPEIANQKSESQTPDKPA
jgi:sec-independent protein translocase protein TatA